MNQACEDWPGLVDSFNGAGPTGWAVNASTVSPALLLLLRRYQATTIGADWIFALVFFTELRAPVIDQVFFDKWLAAVGAAGRNTLAKTFGMIRRSLVQIEPGVAYRFMAGSAEEVFRVPGGTQGREVAPKNGLAACFTDRL